MVNYSPKHFNSNHCSESSGYEYFAVSPSNHFFLATEHGDSSELILRSNEVVSRRPRIFDTNLEDL